MIMSKLFSGHKKVGRNILYNVEQRLIQRYSRLIPLWLETYHLTLMTILWSVGTIGFGYLARSSWHWLWGTAMMIILQYLTDLFDGAIGRQRNTGLVKWGYYMDHFLDYIFLCSLLIGYAFIIPNKFFNMYFFILAILGAFMVNSYLAFAASNRFRIAFFGIGPTEVRLIFLVVNVLLIIFGRTYLAWTLPGILIISTLGLIVTVYRTQQELWSLDMREKSKLPNNNES